ncbi:MULTISPECIES: HAD-IA family hydrolase [unclassified Xanthobacter]|uniref:HAD-IA family hydrolase n=1 Tax=unclassified Xanthobacter TaxID=2623496 RepID=UPI001EDFBA06|nr:MULTISPECIES: HAD-IA family hydrolase [unclassified Xanthobacter]
MSTPSQPSPAPTSDGALTLILFDCDGTLVDSQHMIVQAMHDAHAALGLAVPERAELLSIVGLSLPEAFTVLARGDAHYPVMEMAEAYRSAFMRLRDIRPPEPMFPGAREVLEGLRARDDVLLGMVTGKARRGVDRVLKAQDMVGWFATIQTADDAPSKPHPAMVQQAMMETGIGPARTVVVGDTSFDMAMARAAGASALGVEWGYHETEALWHAGAQQVVDHFGAVPAALSQLLAAAALPQERRA